MIVTRGSSVMEAVALFDFTATAPDELSFSKGDTVNVVSDLDPNWYQACYQAEPVGGDNPQRRVGYIPANHVKWTRPLWFHGHGCMSRSNVAAMLMPVPVDGTFLIQGRVGGGFSLSVKVHRQRDQPCGGAGQRCHVQHFTILTDDRGMYFLWVIKFKSLDALVKHHATASVSRSEDVFLLRALGAKETVIAWSIRTHASMPKTVKTAVMTMLLIQHRAQCQQLQQPYDAFHAQPGGADPATNAVIMSATTTAATAAATLHSSYAAITISFPSTISIFACPPMSTDDGPPRPDVLHLDDASAHIFGELAALLSTVPCEMVLTILGFLTTSDTSSSTEWKPHAQTSIADDQKTFSVTAQYNFEPQEVGELRFERGDLIEVTDAGDDDWWVGTFGGKAGMFPATYVK